MNFIILKLHYALVSSVRYAQETSVFFCIFLFSIMAIHTPVIGV